MSKFSIQEAFAGSAGPGPNYPSVEVVVSRPELLQQHGSSLVLTAPLATELEIDAAIDDFIRDLEALRKSGKKALKAYQERSVQR